MNAALEDKQLLIERTLEMTVEDETPSVEPFGRHCCEDLPQENLTVACPAAMLTIAERQVRRPMG